MVQHGNFRSLHTCNLGKVCNCRICLLLLGDRSKGRKSQSFEKKRQLETERVNTAKTSREQVPTDLLPALSLEGVALQLGPIAAGKTRGPTSAGKGAFLLTRAGRSCSQRQGREQGEDRGAPHAAPAALPPEGRSGSRPAAPEHLHFLLPAGEHLSCISSGDGLSLMGFRK